MFPHCELVIHILCIFFMLICHYMLRKFVLCSIDAESSFLICRLAFEVVYVFMTVFM